MLTYKLDSAPEEHFSVILPTQYFDKSRTHKLFEGEYRLLLAVLEQALCSYLACMRPRPRTIQQRLLFKELRQWFYAPESVGGRELFAFESICELLNIDADALRARLRSISVHHLPMRHHAVRHPLAPGERRQRTVSILLPASLISDPQQG